MENEKVPLTDEQLNDQSVNEPQLSNAAGTNDLPGPGSPATCLFYKLHHPGGPSAPSYQVLYVECSTGEKKEEILNPGDSLGFCAVSGSLSKDVLQFVVSKGDCQPTISTDPNAGTADL